MKSRTVLLLWGNRYFFQPLDNAAWTQCGNTSSLTNVQRSAPSLVSNEKLRTAMRTYVRAKCWANMQVCDAASVLVLTERASELNMLVRHTRLMPDATWKPEGYFLFLEVSVSKGTVISDGPANIHRLHLQHFSCFSISCVAFTWLACFSVKGGRDSLALTCRCSLSATLKPHK